MIRKLCVTTLFVGLGLAAAGELEAQATFGIRGGVNLANIDTDNPDLDAGKTSRTGFVGGAFFTFRFQDIFSLQPEILYSQKGFSAQPPGISPVEATAEVNYIEIPLLLKLMFGSPAGGVQPQLFVGGAVSFESSCNVVGNFGTNGAEAEVGCDDFALAELSRKKTDFAAVFGAGFDVDAGPVILVFDGRYNLGLVNLEEDDSDFDTKSRVWSFTAGFGFPIGG